MGRSGGRNVTEASGTSPKPPPVDRLSQFWQRIYDRKMVQWSVAYVALAYAIQHGVVLTSEAFAWPEWVLGVSMLLLVLGLPVVMTFAWYHGERSNRHFSTAEVTIVSLLLVIASVVFYAFVQPQQQAAASVASPQQTGAAPAQPGTISVAVLPFANLSSDKEQEFFSDGMTEEINAALAKVQDLRVIARVSAFQFKGQNQDVRSVGQALGVSHLIEGSVRKFGDRLRITAQLVRAGDGVQLWSENYDRNLTDIFAIQEEIAQAIAGALRIPLGLQKGESLVPNRTADLDSYQQYLLARSLIRGRAIDKALAILEPLVARDPNYAPASALLAYAEFLLPVFYSPAIRSGSIEEARRAMETSMNSGAIAARRAIKTDPKNAFAYGALASLEYHQKKWVEADDLFGQALMLDPNDPEILQAYGNILEASGHLKTALIVKQKQLMLEPFVPIYAETLANAMQFNGQVAESIPILEKVVADPTSGYFRDVFLAQAYAATGRFKEAADTLLLSTGNQVSRQSVEDAARLLRQAPQKVAAPQNLPAFYSELHFVYAYAGAPDRIMEFSERGAEIGYTHAAALYDLWQPYSAPLRKTERFKALMRKVGLVDYWRAKGWPDLCKPTTGDDFACE
jgi:TolB-like protein